MSVLVKDTDYYENTEMWQVVALDGESSYRQAVLTGLKNVPSRYPEPGAKKSSNYFGYKFRGC
jgi:hypothetical protein